MSTLASNEHTPPLAIAAVVRREDGRYLFIRRAAHLRAAGYWTPVTGRPIDGESLPDAATREVREEVGIGVVVHDEIWRCLTEGASFELVWFAATPAPGQDPDAVLLDPSEVEAARWLTASEALTLSPMFDATRRFFVERAEAEREAAPSNTKDLFVA